MIIDAISLHFSLYQLDDALKHPGMLKQKDTIRDRSRSTKLTLPCARGVFAGVGVALTYEGVDAVFNVSSYSGASLLQAEARKADGGFATTKRGAARG